jgi:hypothetical protein
LKNIFSLEHSRHRSCATFWLMRLPLLTNLRNLL